MKTLAQLCILGLAVTAAPALAQTARIATPTIACEKLDDLALAYRAHIDAGSISEISAFLDSHNCMIAANGQSFPLLAGGPLVSSIFARSNQYFVRSIDLAR